MNYNEAARNRARAASSKGRLFDYQQHQLLHSIPRCWRRCPIKLAALGTKALPPAIMVGDLPTIPARKFYPEREVNR